MLKKFAEQINEDKEVMTGEVVSEELEAVQASEDAIEEVVAEQTSEIVEEVEEVSEEASEEVSEEVQDLEEASKKVKEEEEEEASDDDEEMDDEDEEEDDMDESEKGKSMKEEEVELTVDVQEDVDALLSGSDAELSEEFKEKAKTVFEAAVKAKVSEQLVEIKESAQAEFEAKLEEARGALAEKVDGYLNYVVEEWVKENALAVERGLKTEIAEEFMAGLKNLFVENYIDVPEEKADLLDDLASAKDELETKLNEEFEKSVEMKKELDAFKAEKALSEACAGLTTTQAEKMQGLAEGVEFETIDQYREKLETIKESYFPKVRATGAEKEESIEAPKTQDLSESMSVYARTLSSMKK